MTEANALLDGGQPFHACIMDLGLTDIDGDELYLLKKFSSSMPFIVLTARHDTKRGFESKDEGARTLVEKETPATLLEVKSATSKNAIRARLDGEQLRHHIDVLMKVRPRNVSEWAAEIGVTDSRLRKAWQHAYRRNPKHVLFLHKLLRYAVHIDDPDKNEPGLGLRPDPQIDEAEYNRMLEYLHCNRTALKECGKSGGGFI